VVIQTRWHEDDLAGWLQTEHKHEGWVVLDLPAINDAGEALWPEQYDIEALEKIKRALPPRDWSALYQQKPSPETGDYFKREWIHTADILPPRETMLVYGGSDYAVTANGGDYTVHVVVGIDSDGRMWLLDLWRGQASSDVWVDAFCDLVTKWKPIGWAEETGQIKSGVGPFLIKRMMERAAYVARESFPTRGDKAVRAQSIRGRMAMNGLWVKSDAPFLSDLISEMMSFPVGVHDDQVDALGLVGQLMDRMSAGSKPKEEEPTKAIVGETLEEMRAPPLVVATRRR
jgi:predicted phage terminase large subunit-like protein